jgi:hypothetical protein
MVNSASLQTEIISDILNILTMGSGDTAINVDSLPIKSALLRAPKVLFENYSVQKFYSIGILKSFNHIIPNIILLPVCNM